MTAAERIFAEALALPEDERIALAERLLASATGGEAPSTVEHLRQLAQDGFAELNAGLGIERTASEVVARLKAGQSLLND